MNNQSNHPLRVDINSQVTPTTDDTTSDEIRQQSATNEHTSYDNTQNCDNFLSSIPPDDENYIQSVLVMVSWINPKHLQSLPDIDHAHILCLREQHYV